MASYKQRGIELDPNAPSPFHLPEHVVQAQDPPEGEEDTPTAEGEGEADAPAEEPFSMEELDALTGEGGGDTDAPEGEEEAPAADEGDAAEEEEKPAGPTEEEMVKEKEESPSATWKKYLQPIIRDVENNLKVPIELRNSYTIGFDGDPDLGFHVVGTIAFPEGIPEDLEEVLRGRQLRYKAYVSPEGILSNHVELVYPSAEPQYQPVFRRNPNVFSG
jgi:hypothetical protein